MIPEQSPLQQHEQLPALQKEDTNNTGGRRQSSISQTEANPGQQTVSCFSSEMSESICGAGEKLQRTNQRHKRSAERLLILLFRVKESSFN